MTAQTPFSEQTKRYWMAVGMTVAIAGLLTAWGIYGFQQYGIALFLLTPFFIGACSTLLYGWRTPLSLKEAWGIGMLSLIVFGLSLFAFAIEGLICLFMAFPIAIALTSLGSLLAYFLVKKAPGKGPVTTLVLIGCIPLTAFLEKDAAPPLSSVVTAIDIAADPETVWENVLAFPQLDEPNEFLFKTGIAYPINARIEGSGVGAVRHCNFTTGSFVEPIVVWDPPRLLKFDVVNQPAPLKEWSFWDIDAPHLHDYFVSKQGQFKLTRLPDGKTRLEGTTWYRHNIRPAFYWGIWSEYILHKIQLRVLNHIRKNAEQAKTNRD